MPALRRRRPEPTGRPRREYLFVVAYARSGSTLLQGVLNSIPGYLIRGENDQALHRLFVMHRALARAKRRNLRRGRQTESGWYGITGYPTKRAPHEIRRLVMRTLIRPKPQHRVVGFKEIRWGQPDIDDYVRFVCQVFPGARFVFNVRDHAAASRSKIWADKPDAVQRMQEIEAAWEPVRKRLGKKAFLVCYDDYAHDVDGLRPLFDWLGEPFDAERLRKVLGRRHSY